MNNLLPKIKAIVADHPDPMNDPKQDPDMANFQINKTPAFVITGSYDNIEPKGSGYLDFLYITSPTRIFVDVKSASHLEPLVSHDEAVPIVNFYKAFVYKTLSPSYFYGPTPLNNELPIAPKGYANTGGGIYGYVACSKQYKSISVPAGFAEEFCNNDDAWQAIK